MAVNSKEYWLPHTLFRQVGNLTAYEIETMGTKYPQARKSSSGIPVFGMIDALNSERKKLTDAMGSSINQDAGEAKLEYELKHENIQAKRILNQTKLGILILKEEANARVKKVFNTVMNVIKNGIKTSSVRLMAVNNQRDIEAILTEEWNTAIDELKSSAKVISWSEDGTAKLLQTRLADIADEDPEFAKAAKGNNEIKD